MSLSLINVVDLINRQETEQIAYIIVLLGPPF